MSCVEQGIYRVRGTAEQSLVEAHRAGDASQIAKGIAETIRETADLDWVVFVMKENTKALAQANKTEWRVIWYDGQRQWSLKEMQDQLASRLGGDN